MRQQKNNPKQAIVPYVRLGKIPVHLLFAGRPGRFDFVFCFAGGSLELRNVTILQLRQLIKSLEDYRK